MADRPDAGAGRGALSGLPKVGHHAHEGGSAPELSGVAGGRDNASGGERADAVHGCDELADVVPVDLVGDVALDVGQAGAPQVEVLADVSGLQSVGGLVVLVNRALARSDLPQCASDRDRGGWA